MNKKYNYILEKFQELKLHENEFVVEKMEGMGNVSIPDLKIENVILLNKSNYIKGDLDKDYTHFVKDNGTLSSAITGVYSGWGYYSNDIEKLAAVMYRIIKNHPFNNGNKRTALMTVITHLKVSMFNSKSDNSIAKSFLKNADSHVKIVVSIAESDTNQYQQVMELIEYYLMTIINEWKEV